MNHSKVTKDLPGGEEMQPCLTEDAKAYKQTTLPIGSETTANRTPKTFVEKVFSIFLKGVVFNGGEGGF